MPATYEKIATTTLGSAASTITFSSIASSWTDLRLVLTATGSVANYVKLNFNSDTATNYSDVQLYANSGGYYSTTDTIAGTIYIEGGFSQMSTTIPVFYALDIFSYAGSTFKTFLSEASMDKNGSGSIARLAGLWRSTAAINRIDLAVNTGNFATGSTATLYGILKA